MENRENGERITRRAVLTGTVAIASGAAGRAGSTQDTTPDAIQRGSDKVLEMAGSGGQTFSATDIRQIIDVFRKHKGRFTDWCQYGQPSVDGVCGTVVLAPSVVGPALADVLGSRSVLNWHFGVFPKGTPAIDHVLVSLRAGRSGGVIVHG